jgi:hypothetical protein
VQDYGFRLYNPGLGRFLSVDPLRESYPWYTPYQFAGNMPITSIDLDGAEPKDATGAGDAVPYRGPQDDDKIASTPTAEVTTRALRLREIGMDAFRASGDIYSESYNPNLVVKYDFLDRAYHLGHMLELAMPVGKLAGAGKATAGAIASKAKTVFDRLSSFKKYVASKMKWADEGAEAAQNLRRLSGNADEGMEFLDEYRRIGRDFSDEAVEFAASAERKDHTMRHLIKEGIIKGNPASKEARQN